MKQTKKQATKKPINVQLSKDDLKELLVVLKNFIVDELLNFHKRDAERIMNLEIAQAWQKARIKALEQPLLLVPVYTCPHEDRFESVWYSLVKTRFHYSLGIRYKCKWCGRIRSQHKEELSSKQRKALKKLGVEL